jgi:ABC-type uncharacterized transport system permease subunit
MIHALSITALVLYLVAAWLYRRERHAVGSALTLAGALFHLLYLILWLKPGPSFDLGHVLSVVAFFSVTGFLIFGRRRFRALSALALLLVLVIYLASAVLIHYSQSETRQWDLLLSVHVATTLAGLVCFIFCSFVSFSYLLQSRVLKSGRAAFGILGRLPSLRELAAVGRQFLAAGVWTLTVGLWLGFIYAANSRLQMPLYDPKLIWSAVLLVYFGALLALRGGLGERKLARYCSLGVVLVFIALFFSVSRA